MDGVGTEVRTVRCIGVSASRHALLLSTQYQHMENTVVSECSLIVTVCQSAVND